mgnify:CR=1 FL=1
MQVSLHWTLFALAYEDSIVRHNLVVIEHAIGPLLPDSRYFDGRNGLGRDSLAATCEAQSFRRCRLDADSVAGDSGDTGDAGNHGLAVRADARCFTDKGKVEMDDPTATRGEKREGMHEKALGGGAAPLRIGGREVLADVAGADRAQHGIGQRMQRDIGIRMPKQFLVMRHEDAAQAAAAVRPAGRAARTIAE